MQYNKVSKAGRMDAKEVRRGKNTQTLGSHAQRNRRKSKVYPRRWMMREGGVGGYE